MQHKVIQVNPKKYNRRIRLDKFLAVSFSDHSRSYLQKLIKKSKVKVNNSVCLVPRTQIVANDLISVDFPEENKSKLISEEISLPVIHEDDDILIINKPSGMPVHPGAGNKNGTIVNAVAAMNKDFLKNYDSEDERPGVVHRLDKDTSGCLIVAKNPRAKFAISKAFSERKVTKTYLALVKGIPKVQNAKIENFIGRDSRNRTKMAVVKKNGKNAVSRYKVLHSGKIENLTASLLQINILTGRTHQIRVQMADMGHPVIGDSSYGDGFSAKFASRQMLHAWKIVFPAVNGKKTMMFEAGIPDDLKEMIDKLKKNPLKIK